MATLTERYVDAAVSGVAQSQRDDVAAELRTSVADAVDDLTAQGLSPEAAEVRALTDLGDPAALAERFGGRPRHLIGPAYFGHYSQLLRTLLFVVLPIVAVASLIAQGLTDASPIEGVLSALGVVFQTGVQIAFWVTVVFAVLERSHTPMPTREWTPADLPEVVHRRIGLGETAFGISVLTLLIWALFWQRDHWQVTIDGELLPVLAPAAWSPWLVLLLVILLAMVVLEIVKYRSGRWTVRLATWNTVLNLGFASIVVVLWAQESLLSPGILEAVPGGLLNPVPWIVVAITVFDTAEGWWSLRRGSSAGE
jgi:hypothetical protein